ncbi:hypothetical protein BGAL_0382g00040 [Botrytis galanthina]|uniref:Uncharacterized protein n=1 Tax=Botrytis galanthina TaxID=278940 RepID=A0A4V4HTQ5_9HELO|nr:hypothetical protein BGAL_0382g00040 [Botrytis galanthina]
MSNQPEKEESPFQPLPPLPQVPEWGIMLPESSPPDSIGRPLSFPTSYVRGGRSVAHDRSPASGIVAPNMVVSDRAESARGRSASGLLRAGGSLHRRPRASHDQYDMTRYHAIHNNARTFHPVNSGTMMNNGPAGNPPPNNSDFVNGARGHSAHHTVRSQDLEWSPAFTTDQAYPHSTAMRRQLVASPAPALAPVTASGTVRATSMTAAPAPVPAPPSVRAVPASSSTRSRTQKQTSAAIQKIVKKPTAKKPTAKKSTAKRPSKDRSSFCIPRISIKESELAIIRAGYGTLLPRKEAFKKAPPGASANIEITFGEWERLCVIRDNGAEMRQAYYNNPKPKEIKKAMFEASERYEKTYEKQRANARSKGYPEAMPLANRFPVVALAAAAASSAALAVAPIVAANAAASTEDQEMADSDSVSPESSFYGESEDEDMEEE